MKNPVQISALVITYNEENNIERCLNSLDGIADEIVVIDSFSTDRTAQVCKDRGVDFVQHRFEGHIEQKNYALSRANNDHVLSLDADEALSEILKQSILTTKQTGRMTVMRLTG